MLERHGRQTRANAFKIRRKCALKPRWSTDLSSTLYATHRVIQIRLARKRPSILFGTEWRYGHARR
eukprot:7098873-Alexandrium_andersonii.AAC.1